MSRFSYRLKCPHCRSDSTFLISDIFTVAQHADDAKIFSISSLCGHLTCHQPVGLRVQAINPDRLFEAGQITRGYPLATGGRAMQDITPFFRILNQYPPEPSPDIPDFLSDKVKRAFTQAEQTRLAGQNLLSSIGYRSALDLATKDINPPENPIKIEMLGPRLGRLSREGFLTKSLGEWAEHIGYLGNASTHDGEELSNAELDELAMLTKMTLIYLVTLPETVNRLRGTPKSDSSDIDQETIAQRLSRWITFKPRLSKKLGTR